MRLALAELLVEATGQNDRYAVSGIETSVIGGSGIHGSRPGCQNDRYAVSGIETLTNMARAAISFSPVRMTAMPCQALKRERQRALDS